MLLSRFSCPQCSATLKPAKPQPEGVRVKCPKCSTVFSVAADRDELDEEVEPAPARRTSLTSKPASSSRRRPADDFEDDEEDRPRRTSRASRDDGDDEDDRPRRPSRRAARDDDDEEVDRPAPARRGKKHRAQKSGGLAVLWIGLALIGGLVGLVVAGVVVYRVTRPLMESEQQKQVRLLDEATSLLAQVNDQASAERVKSPLVKIAEQLYADELAQREKLEAAMKNLDPNQVKEAIEKGMANPQAAQAEHERIQALKMPVQEAIQRLAREGGRVWKVPGGKELLTSFCEAWHKPPVMFGLSDLGGFPGGPNAGGGLIPPAGFPQPGANPSKCNKDSWARVHPGMTEDQATEILGQPVMTHPFGPDEKALHFHGDGFGGILTIKGGKVANKNPG